MSFVMPRLGLVLAACSLRIADAARKGRAQPSSMELSGVPVVGLEASEKADEWMLFFEEGVTNQQLSEFCSQFKQCVAGHPDQGGVPFVAVYSIATQELRSVLSKRAAVMPNFASPDTIMEDDPRENTNMVTSSSSGVWGVERVGRGSMTGRGVHAYILDSGVRTTHQDFGGRGIPTTEIGWRNTITECNGNPRCANDDRGHGTHCAGSVGGATYGVAPEVFVHAMDRGSRASNAYTSLDWLANNAEFPAVLSMSFGTQNVQEAARAAVGAVIEAGITVVVAAGNWRSDACEFTYAWLPGTITVAATTSTDERAAFSNWGTCVTLFAPGEDIISTDYAGDSATSVKSGTSMAAPHVTGAVALLLESSPNLTPEQVRARLLETASTGELTEIRDTDPNILLQNPVPR